jgi:GT2 family glycosyltransferase
MLANKTLSVIVVNYKSDQFLRLCLASVYATMPRGLEFEIIVINNDTKDISGEVKDFDAVKLIDHRKNVGFGAAVNLGAKAAKGINLLFLNPDSKICSKNIKEVLSFFERNSKVAIIGSKVISEKGTVQEWIGGRETGLYDLVRNNLNFPRSRHIWKSTEPISVDWVSGTALFVRKDFFHEVGGFDEKFFMYFEDMDLCKRLRKKNKEIFYYPDFCVEHFGGQSYSDKAGQKKDYYQSQEYVTKIVGEKKLFQHALKTAGLFSSGGSNEITLKIDAEAKNVFVYASGAETGENSTELKFDITGPSQEVVFNVKYLLDGINVVSTEQVAILSNSESTPVAIQEINEKTGEILGEFVYIAMPIKN